MAAVISGVRTQVPWRRREPARPTRRLTDNRLLALLPATERASLAGALEWFAIPPQGSLYEPHRPLQHVYFPTQGVISVLAMDGVACAELAVVGYEGMLGVALILGGETTPSQAVTRTWCFGYRLPGEVIEQCFCDGKALHDILLRYTETLITQCSLNAVCYLHHATEQQVCRWLLHTIDRAGGDTLDTTNELIGRALGVRRQTVTAAAQKLARQGLIRHSPGRIRVLDRAGLEQHSCECYGIVRDQINRLLPAEPTSLSLRRRP